MIQKNKYSSRILAFVMLFTLGILFSCNKDFPEPTEKTANEYIYEKFIDWYLWYDEIPVIDPNGIESREALVDSIRNPVDNWSFVASYTTVQSWYQKGEYTGFGAGFMIDNEQTIRITHVYTDSPFGRLGVERGWKVRSVNGYTVQELDRVNEALNSEEEVVFEMEDRDSASHRFSVKRGSIHANSVLHHSIHPSGNRTIGYLVFDSFLNTSSAELKAVADTFSREQITDLIVDLRYNGGGLNSVAYQLVGMIGGERVKGQVISTVQHNPKHSSQNESTRSEYEGTVFPVSSVYFITTSHTASASELVINALEPYMDVRLVGENTHGKPVGMYIFKVEKYDLAIVPVSFKSVNSEGFGDYFRGLPADFFENDDLTKNWGDPEEDMLKTTLGLISNPIASATGTKSQAVRSSTPWPYTGIHQIIGAW